MPPRDKAARDAARPELPDPSTDILKSLNWMSLEHPEHLAPESRVLHNNMEVLARLSTTILQGLRTRPTTDKAPRSRSVSSRSAADVDEEDDEAALEDLDNSQEQMALREQLKEYGDIMEDFHRQWIEQGNYTPYVTRRQGLDADAEAFFTEVRMAGLPSLNEGLEDEGEESPLAQLLASLTHKSEAIMYIHYNKGFKAKNPAKPKKSSLKKTATASKATSRRVSTTGAGAMTDRSSYSPGPSVFGSGSVSRSRTGGPSRTPLDRDRSPLPESTTSSFRERSPLMTRTPGGASTTTGGGSRSGSGSVRGGTLTSNRRPLPRRSRVIPASDEEEEEEDDAHVMSNGEEEEDDLPRITSDLPRRGA